MPTHRFLLPLVALALIPAACGSGTPESVPPGSFHDITFAAYHSQDEIHAFLAQEADAHPDFVRLESLGASLQGRRIEMLVVSNHEPGVRPALYFNGTHHGDEWAATEAILGLADYLIEHRHEPDVAGMLDSYTFYLQPLVNPDGHLAHTRADSQGRDPNRDYWSPAAPDSPGFASPEIRIVRDLIDRIRPRAAAAYHSGLAEVLWPWGYTGNAPAGATALAWAGQQSAEALGFDRYLQSHDDYPTQGEFIDYAFAQYATAAFTFEVSAVKTPDPSALDGVVRSSVRAAFALVASIDAEHATGTLPRPELLREARGSYGALGRRTEPRLE